MFTKKSIFRMFSILLVVLLMNVTASARPLDAPPPLGTGFTYQGKLIDGGAPANGTYDFEFTLYDVLSDGSPVGKTVTQKGVIVTNGLFTVQLDFGDVFDGTSLYLEIGVQPGGSGGAFTTLTPRQPLTAAPYALYTTQASNSALLNNQQATYYQNASNINSGALGTNFFSAYADLVVEGYLGNAAGDLAINNGTLQATLNSDLLDGSHAGNASGAISINNGTLNTNLNADLLDGSHASAFALTGHNHWGQTWSGSGTGLTLSGGTIGLTGYGDYVGVYGLSFTTGGYGVYGSGYDGYGVYGSSSNNTGVYGSGGFYGVYGVSYTTSGGSGVSGISSNGYGVSGDSISGYGVYGHSSTSYAGYFAGNVRIVGNQTVTGTKSAVVKTQDYGTRTLYAVESPENWFQDFGTGQLTNGKTVITIDPVFAETVNLADDYHVFFTPMGDCALFVTDKTPTSFTVKAQGGQTCSIAFDYNIVAKRLGYETVRLAEVTDTEPLLPAEGGAK